MPSGTPLSRDSIRVAGRRILQFATRQAIFLDSTHALIGVGTGQMREATAGDSFFDQKSAHAIYTELPVGLKEHPLLSLGARIYLPGNDWYRIDPATGATRHVGPGIRSEGKRIGNDLDYFISAHFGLAAFSQPDGCFFRISLDPAHRLGVAATADPAPDVAPPSGDGTVEITTQEVIFHSGLGR